MAGVDDGIQIRSRLGPVRYVPSLGPTRPVSSEYGVRTASKGAFHVGTLYPKTLKASGSLPSDDEKPPTEPSLQNFRYLPVHFIRSYAVRLSQSIHRCVDQYALRNPPEPEAVCLRAMPSPKAPMLPPRRRERDTLHAVRRAGPGLRRRPPAPYWKTVKTHDLGPRDAEASTRGFRPVHEHRR